MELGVILTILILVAIGGAIVYYIKSKNRLQEATNRLSKNLERDRAIFHFNSGYGFICLYKNDTHDEIIVVDGKNNTIQKVPIKQIIKAEAIYTNILDGLNIYTKNLHLPNVKMIFHNPNRPFFERHVSLAYLEEWVNRINILALENNEHEK
ncbi:MAG: hypothetical protein AAGB30_11255 [Pedobacter sp.]|nr:hypothetical protein [Pedobacter sp.]